MIFLGPPGTGKSHLSIALGSRRRGEVTGSPSPMSGCSRWVRSSGRDGPKTSSSGRGGSWCSPSTRSATSRSTPRPRPFLHPDLLPLRAVIARRELQQDLLGLRRDLRGPGSRRRHVDRLVHHAEVIVLRGDSYWLKGKGKEVMGSEGATGGGRFSDRRYLVHFPPALTDHKEGRASWPAFDEAAMYAHCVRSISGIPPYQ